MMKRALPYILLFALLLGADMISKWWVQDFLVQMPYASRAFPYGGIALFKNFFGIEGSIVYVSNRGAAWGSFANSYVTLLVLRIGVSTALAVYLFFCKRAAKTTLPLVLILFGAVGNIIDCFIYGHVIDMIHLKFWGYSYPVFNLADSAICIGAVWLAIQSWRSRERIEVA
ncbi:MAG: signal peptidase II [Chlamydiales bacterium]|nr:signal peptidase II [Chlamydiales bacterium]